MRRRRTAGRVGSASAWRNTDRRRHALTTPNRAEATWFAPQIGGDSAHRLTSSRARHLRQCGGPAPSPSHCGAEGALLVTGDDAPIVGAGSTMHRPMPTRAAPAMPLRRRRQSRLQDELSCRRPSRSAVAAAGQFIRSGGVSRLDRGNRRRRGRSTAAARMSARSSVQADGGCDRWLLRRVARGTCADADAGPRAR